LGGIVARANIVYNAAAIVGGHLLTVFDSPMIKALRGSRRDELIALTRRHLEPSPQAYIKAYERRFGKADLADLR
jgi:hypothetical protein